MLEFVTSRENVGRGACCGTTDRDEFLVWVKTNLYEAELALHNSDADPRRALWSRNEPVSVLAAWRNAHGHDELDGLFTSLARSFSDCTSYRFDLEAYDAGASRPTSRALPRRRRADPPRDGARLSR
jgi:hypothetical protein